MPQEFISLGIIHYRIKFDKRGKPATIRTVKEKTSVGQYEFDFQPLKLQEDPPPLSPPHAIMEDSEYQDAMNTYDVEADMVRFAIDTYGKDRYADFLRALADNDHDIEAAMGVMFVDEEG